MPPRHNIAAVCVMGHLEKLANVGVCGGEGCVELVLQVGSKL